MKNSETSSKDKSEYLFLLYALLLASLPAVSCWVRLLASSASFNEIWPPLSRWFDEIFYFKQTEDIITYGMPQGFFGFNESSSASGSFGAWVPVILYPAALFGKLFGYGQFSPYIFNIVFLSVSLLLFGVLARINLGDMSAMYLLLFAFPPLSRYMFSYRPEILIIGSLTVFFGIYISAKIKAHPVKDVFMYLILICLTVMRPYLVLLFVLPLLSAFEQKGISKLIYILACVFSAASSILLFAFVNSRFTSPYIGNTHVTFFDNAFVHTPAAFIGSISSTLEGNFTKMFSHIESVLDAPDMVGACFTIYMITSLLLLVGALSTFVNNRFLKLPVNKKTSDPAPVSGPGYRPLMYLLLFVVQICILVCVLTIYGADDGYMHLLALTVLDLIIICTDSYIFRSFKMLSGVICIFAFTMFFLVKTDTNMQNAVPYFDTASPVRERYAVTEESIKEKMPLSEGISWDNTVDIVYDPEGGSEIICLIPRGFGISLCEEEYLDANINSLKSRYLILPKGNSLCEKALNSGYESAYDIETEYVLFSKK